MFQVWIEYFLNNLLIQYNDKIFRFAGMLERGKKTKGPATSSETLYLSELLFYTSHFKNTNNNIKSYDTGFNLITNDQNSHPSIYFSPFRSFGVGTFTNNNEGVFEPLGRSHIHTKKIVDDLDPAGIFKNISGATGTFSDYPKNIWKGGVFTKPFDTNSLDIYLGELDVPNAEDADPLKNGLEITKPKGSLDSIIRRDSVVKSGTNKYAIFRFGVRPTIYDNLNLQESGINANEFSNTFGLNISPLNPGNTFSKTLTPIGVGIHSLYPKSRIHLFGKIINTQLNEETNTLGEALAAGQTKLSSSFYPKNQPSGGQISIDYLEDEGLYNTKINEYSYEIWEPSGTGESILGSSSSNSANYPFNEILKPTREHLPWNYSTKNIHFSSTNLPHGLGKTLNYIDSYIGFNVYRNLTKEGDTKGALWRTGINVKDDSQNGGSLIYSTNDGNLFISNIKNDWNRGINYAWEQELTIRDILNLTNFVFEKNANFGINTMPGYDKNAYPSLERDIASGKILYLPTGVAPLESVKNHSPANYDSSTSLLNKSNLLPYGYVNYSALNSSSITAFSETPTDSPAAQINKNATKGENFKIDVSGDKLFDKNSKLPYKMGWGYPKNLNIEITDAAHINAMLNLSPGYTNNIQKIILSTDLEGRVYRINFVQQNAPSATINNIDDYFISFIAPNPKDFNDGNPFHTYISGSFTAPEGSQEFHIKHGSQNVKFKISSYLSSSHLDYNKTRELDYESFSENELYEANIRLNNFSLGEGLPKEIIKNETWGQQIINSIQEKRKQSPKIVFSFLESSGNGIPGIDEILDNSNRTRPTTNNEPYRKVSTVLMSAQNESTLREYWIPKADNTGGTFMVFTDHYGSKEKDNGLNILTTDKFFLEEIITFEPFINPYDNVNDPNAFITSIYSGPTGSFDNGIISSLTSPTDKDCYQFPGFVRYFNRMLSRRGDKNFQKYFSNSQWGQKIDIFGKINPTDANPYPNKTQAVSPLTNSLINLEPSGPTGARQAVLWRNIDKSYELLKDEDEPPVWDKGIKKPNGGSVNNKPSEFRFKRINSNYALIDFNFTIEMKNIPIGNLLGTTNINDNRDHLIDRGSARFTQYIKITYDIANNGSGSGLEYDYFIKLFGNNLGFSPQSQYNKWYPGVAFVSSGEKFDKEDNRLSPIDYPMFTVTPENLSQRGILGATYNGWFPQLFN